MNVVLVTSGLLRWFAPDRNRTLSEVAGAVVTKVRPAASLLQDAKGHLPGLDTRIRPGSVLT